MPPPPPPAPLAPTHPKVAGAPPPPQSGPAQGISSPAAGSQPKASGDGQEHVKAEPAAEEESQPISAQKALEDREARRLEEGCHDGEEVPEEAAASAASAKHLQDQLQVQQVFSAIVGWVNSLHDFTAKATDAPVAHDHFGIGHLVALEALLWTCNDGRAARLQELGDRWVQFCIRHGATANCVRLSALVQDDAAFLKETGILDKVTPEALEEGKGSRTFAILSGWTRTGPDELSPGGKLTTHEKAPSPASPPVDPPASPPSAPYDRDTDEVDYTTK